jgi:hypothetical protein
MKLGSLEFRKDVRGHIFYFAYFHSQRVGGITSRINDNWDNHRILLDFDDCELKDVKKSIIDLHKKYDFGLINIISDKFGSYGAVCNTVISFKEYMRMLIDTEYIDPLYVKYTLERHEAILRLSDKKGRELHRDIIYKMKFNSHRPMDNSNYMLIDYDTGIGGNRFQFGDFKHEQKNI